MAHRVCPPWIGYFLLNPLRKLIENPRRMLSPYVREGMTVLEPGCGMGYFTLPLAELVGPSGRVVAVDIQEKMLAVLGRRARKSGVEARIECRLAGPNGLGLDDLAGKVDLAVALYVVHEVPDQEAFFRQVSRTLKPGARLLAVEPRGHVSAREFERMKAFAAAAGLALEEEETTLSARRVLLSRPS